MTEDLRSTLESAIEEHSEPLSTETSSTASAAPVETAPVETAPDAPTTSGVPNDAKASGGSAIHRRGGWC